MNFQLSMWLNAMRNRGALLPVGSPLIIPGHEIIARAQLQIVKPVVLGGGVDLFHFSDAPGTS